MNNSPVKHLVSTKMTCLGMFVSMLIVLAINELALPMVVKIFLSFALPPVIWWVPVCCWALIKYNKQQTKERQELEEKYAAQDAELLSQYEKHHG